MNEESLKALSLPALKLTKNELEKFENLLLYGPGRANTSLCETVSQDFNTIK